jgi:creatinine amidohydrolase
MMRSVFISTATSQDEAHRAADVAVLPVGSFEQHGSHLPLATDTLIAALIARRIAVDYDLFLLPPVTVSCSHEHAGFPGTVSIGSVTLHAIVDDIRLSLERQGVEKLVIVNGHGGNYVLANIVQEANVAQRRMVLYPQAVEWREARSYAGVETDNHADMHAGEAETSILLSEAPELVGENYRDADFTVDDRRYLLTLGVGGYSETGVIGKPSLATRDKGRRLLDSFAAQFKSYLAQLRA